jgi:hypothetical protein
MIESDLPLSRYATSAQQPGEDDRLPIGHAALAMFGLSTLAWALVIGRFLALLQ